MCILRRKQFEAIKVIRNFKPQMLSSLKIGSGIFGRKYLQD